MSQRSKATGQASEAVNLLLNIVSEEILMLPNCYDVASRMYKDFTLRVNGYPGKNIIESRLQQLVAASKRVHDVLNETRVKQGIPLYLRPETTPQPPPPQPPPPPKAEQPKVATPAPQPIPTQPGSSFLRSVMSSANHEVDDFLQKQMNELIEAEVERLYPVDFRYIDVNGRRCASLLSLDGYVDGADGVEDYLSIQFEYNGVVPRPEHPAHTRSLAGTPYTWIRRELEDGTWIVQKHGKQTGEARCIRLMYIPPGTKIRYWAHSRGTGRDLENAAKYYVSTGLELTEVSYEEFEALP